MAAISIDGLTEQPGKIIVAASCSCGCKCDETLQRVRLSCGTREKRDILD